MVKILQLYDINHNKIAGLKNYKEFNIQREINQLDILSFLYPVNDVNNGLIKEECYIRTKENEYVVKEVNTQDDDWAQYVCKVNIEGIQGIPVSHFETVEQLCQDSVTLALAGTGWTVGSCDVTKLRTVKKNNCNAYVVLQEIQSAYGCEMAFDAINKKVNIHQSTGSDKGVYFAEQLNLKKLDVQRNSYDYITRLIPIGKDGLDIISVNGGNNYVENYQYSDKVITAYWEDNRYTVAADLLEDAIIRLDYLSKPYKAYKADVYDLANNSDTYKNILDYSLGDTITLMAKSKDTKEKQRIVKLTEYPEEFERNTVEIANKIASLDVLNARFANTSDTVDSVTTSDGGLDGSKIDNIDFDKIQHFHAAIADIDSLSATIANIGKLTATEGDITLLNAANANIQNLLSYKAEITDLTAATGRISILESKAASIDTLLAGNLSVANMQAGFITADSGLIANGAIGDAQINNVSAAKINTGILNTGLVSIQSASGNMLISDNTIQIKDSSRVRVQIGKDAGNDYNMYVWDNTGKLMFDATGLHADGIKDKIIRDDMISDTANIDAVKINIDSLFTQINNSTNTIKSSKIFLDTQNQTLKIAFDNLSTAVSNQDLTVSSQGTSIEQIQGQISSKIWSADITTAVNGIQVGGRNLLTDSDLTKQYTGLSFTVGGITYNTYAIGYAGYNANIPNPATSYHSYIDNSAFGFPVVTYNESDGTRNWKGANKDILSVVKEMGYGQYTISFDVYATGIGTKLFGGFFYTKAGGTSPNFYSGQYNISILKVNEWHRVNATINLNNDYDISKSITFYVYGYGFSTNSILYVRKYKLEKSNKATDWASAPEDVQGKIDATNTNISTNYSTTSQTNDMISNQVGAVSTDLHNNYSTTSAMNSAINQSANSITSSVSSTYATIANLNTTNGNVSTAQSTANSALNTATTANGTANTLRDTTVPNLATRVSNAELKITPDAIVSTVSKSAMSSSSPSVSIDDVDSNITYSGSWTASTLSGYYGNTYHVSNVANDYIQYTFLGTGIEAYMLKNTNLGICEIFIDGISKGTFDCYSSITLYQQKIYSITSLTYGTHIFKIVVKGTKNASSTDYKIVFDYCKILNSQAIDTTNISSKIQQSASDVQIAFNNITSNIQNSSGQFNILNGNINVYNTSGQKVMYADTSGLLSSDRGIVVYDKVNGSGTQYIGHIIYNIPGTSQPLYIESDNGFQFKSASINGQGGRYEDINCAGLQLDGWRWGGDNGQTFIRAVNYEPYLVTLYNQFRDANMSIKANEATFSKLTVSGAKQRVVETSFGKVAMNAYETPNPMFGDVGDGKITDGECIITFDPIFAETISPEAGYYVFLTQCGQGNIYVDERNTNYFVVKGTEGLTFCWEIKAKQKGYENDRLDVQDCREENNLSEVDENTINSLDTNVFDVQTDDILNQIESEVNAI